MSERVSDLERKRNPACCSVGDCTRFVFDVRCDRHPDPVEQAERDLGDFMLYADHFIEQRYAVTAPDMEGPEADWLEFGRAVDTLYSWRTHYVAALRAARGQA